MSKILVTGGAGFIGSYVAEEFLQNNYKVVIADNLSTGNRRNLPEEAVFYKMDLNDKEQIEKLLSREKPEIISHHASNLVGIPQSIDNPQKAMEDIIMSVDLFEIAVRNGVEKIIFASSANVYSPRAQTPINEHSAVFPSSPYGVMKLAIESYLSFMQRAERTNSVILRYFNVYGPRQKFRNEAGIIPLLINHGLHDHPTNIYGNGKQTRDFTYVSDVAAANLLAAETDLTGVFNVGSGRAVSINELIEVLENILGKRLKINYCERRNEIRKSAADVNKIKTKMNWRAKTKLDIGLRKTLNYYE